MRSYDVAVIGLGAAGAAALSALARAGADVVGIDQFKPPHAFGSSHGETRLLRTAYSEGAFYVPLVRRAITLWRELEARTSTRLFEQTGVTYAGARDDPFIASARDAARRWKLNLRPVEGLEAWFRLPGDWLRLSDIEGGFLHPERAIAALLKDAKAHGATVLNDTRCEAVDASGATIQIPTSRGRIEAERVVVTTGAWTAELLPELRPITHVERRVVHWFADPARRFTRESGLAPFALSTGNHQLFYGFPANAKGEVKVGEHDTVQIVDGPEALKRKITRSDIAAIRPLVRRLMPGLGRHVRSQVCMYPMAKDERFILDRHPDDGRITIGAGLSGHGFKFAPAIGEVLANLALDKKQKVDVKTFRLAGRC